MNAELIHNIDAIFAPWDRPGTPGCAVGIIQDGALVYDRGLGLANLEHDISIASATVFDIASTSKQFTAACVALLAEASKLDFDDDVRRFINELPDFGQKVTLRHLLHHTSGWRDYLTLFELAGYREDDYIDDADVMSILTRQQRLNFPPGERYAYSNTGYYLLGVVVERVSGLSLAAFANDHIFGPLGMNHTWFQDDHTRIVPRRATGYSPKVGGGYRVDMTTLDMVGDGALLTCIDDLVLWDRNFYNNQLGAGGPALIRLMTTPGQLNNGEAVDYGFGLDLAPYRGLLCVSHGGWFVGYRSEMMRFPSERFTVICLANSSDIDPTALCSSVADLWLGEALAANPNEPNTGNSQPSAPVTFPSEPIAGMYYDDTTQRVIEITTHLGDPAVDFGAGPRPLSAVIPGHWRTADDSYDIFLRDQGLNVTLFGRPHGRYSGAEPHAPEPAWLDQLTGIYHSAELDASYALTQSGDELWAQVGRTATAQARSAIKDVMQLGDRTLSFTADENGHTIGFTLSANRAWGFWFARQPAGNPGGV